MTATFFLLFVIAVAAAIMLITARVMARTAARPILIGLPLWLIYVGTLSRLGIVADADLRPPGIAFIVGPVLLFVIFGVVRSRTAKQVALAVSLPMLMGLQSFRIVVELFLHRLWGEGLVPRMLTFEGANIDIVIGLTALPMAWLSTRGRGGLWTAMTWSAAGLVVLANVIVRSALTAPGPLNLLHTAPPNLAVSTFPYTFVAGFLAPLAITLHVLAIRALRERLRAPVRCEADPAGSLP